MQFRPVRVTDRFGRCSRKRARIAPLPIVEPSSGTSLRRRSVRLADINAPNYLSLVPGMKTLSRARLICTH